MHRYDSSLMTHLSESLGYRSKEALIVNYLQRYEHLLFFSIKRIANEQIKLVMVKIKARLC